MKKKAFSVGTRLKKFLTITTLLILVLALSGFAVTVQAQPDNMPIEVFLDQGYGFIHYHYLYFALAGQSGIACGKATVGVRWVGTTFENPWNFWVTINGVFVGYVLNGPPTVQGDFLVMHATSATIPYPPPATQIPVGPPITLVMYDKAPYLTVAYGNGVWFVAWAS